MKLFKKHNMQKVNPTNVMAWAVVKLENGTIKLPATDVEFAVLVSNQFRDGANKVEWTFNGTEWHSVTPDTWDVYWLGGC